MDFRLRSSLAAGTLALLVVAAPSQGQVLSGAYVGNGVNDRSISDVGFRPDVVIVKGDNGNYTFFKTSTMPADSAKRAFGNTGLYTGRIKSLTADGFTLGTNADTNGSGDDYYWIAFKEAAGELDVGTYTGDGNDNRSITSVGFQPDYVIIIAESSSPPQQSSSAMGVGMTFDFDTDDNASNRIQAFEANGFQLGTHSSVNASGVTYHYAAWKAVPGQMAVGSYPGNGSDNRSIGVGFQPGYVMVQGDFANWGAHKPTATGDNTDQTLHMGSASNESNNIQKLEPSGFQVGTHTRVNNSGNTYYWMVWGGGGSSPLQVTKASSTLTVTAPGSFEMRFNEAFGWSVDQFYDLAEDPTKANDFAGGSGGSNLLNGILQNGMTVGATAYSNDTNADGPKLDLLEVTPTRVRVRQEAFYEAQSGGGATVAGIKSLGDYSIYPSGKLATKWERRAGANVTTVNHGMGAVVVHATAGGDLDRGNWTFVSDSGAGPANPGTDTFSLAKIDVVGARTDFLSIIYQDYADASSLTIFENAGQNWAGWSYVDGDGTTYNANTSETWNFLTYFKPTDLGNTGSPETDPKVTVRRDDYRGPSTLSISTGNPWQHASEQTGGGDDFNESEGVYVATFDPANGLIFDIDGSATTRFSPFFKIRQWRSFTDPPTVDLEGVTLSNDAHYRADVKPVARSHWAGNLTLHTTLEDSASVDSSPDVGSTGIRQGTTSFVTGRYGNGALFDAAGEYVEFPLSVQTGNMVLGAGAVELWYQPNYNHTDLAQHRLWHYSVDGTNFMYLQNGSSGDLLFRIRVGAVLTDITVASADYSWQPGEWVHLRTTWDQSAPLATQARIFINGREPTHTDPVSAYVAASMPNTGSLIFGADSGGTRSADGIIDEFRVYSNAGAPQLLAAGGLASDPKEYLASSTRNFTLSFDPVDGSGRGEYFYAGADSQFLGLNVALLTNGVSAGADLRWEFWNGSQWTNLESGGFVDGTDQLTHSGTVYWTEPSGWMPYSINGEADLYYVRASLTAGTYGTKPIESLIKTDILLFQYSGDITLAAQTFTFDVALPTAVALESLEARSTDGGAVVSWQTATELNNLGFHLYRATSESGPFERITAAAIPGLGSSPVGASYRYQDSGLTNGATYYYKLEDIETTGKRKVHGPISVTPSSASAHEVDAPSRTRLTYGNPAASTLRILQGGERQVVLELLTEGFYAEPQEDGSVRLEVPGFDTSELGGVAVPVKRTWVEAIAGRKVTLVSVDVQDVQAFTSLRPEPVDIPEIVARHYGTVRAARRRARRTVRAEGLSPTSAAQISSVGFQGETKKALVELAPLRWDPSTGRLLLARRLVVHLSFREREPSELSTGGNRGRREPRRQSHDQRTVAARFRTAQWGLHRVLYEEVMRDRRGVPATKLRLSRQGDSVAFHIEPNWKSFEPGSVMYFVSDGARANPYGNEAVYELETRSEEAGVTMATVSAAPSGELRSVYRHRIELEENRFYQAALVDAPDVWLWDLIFAPESKSYSFDIRGLAADSKAPATLSVWLQGVSDFQADPDHHVRFYVNSSFVNELSWDGKLSQRVDFELPLGLLREGENILQIENVGDTEATYSMVMLDRYAIEYARVAWAIDGRLDGRFDESGVAEVSGLESGAYLLDVSDAEPRWLTGAEHGADGKLRFRTENARRYLAVSPEAVLKPVVAESQASRLKSRNLRADYVVIGPAAFLHAAAPLLQLRQREGLQVMAVAVEDIYSEFGFGEATPQAVKDFLSYAFHNWSEPTLRYVLLLGDATYDFKDHLKTGVTNQVPPWMTKTTYMWTASDPSYAAVNGDDPLPDLALGRLPAASVEQVRAIVQKVVDYESSKARLRNSAVVLVTDDADDAGNFEADAELLAATVLAAEHPERIHLGQLGTSAARDAIVQSFDRGASLVSYLGHGGIHLWAAENLFNTNDVATLAPQARQPLLLTMNCLNGYFHFPYFDSLAEALVLAPDRGAIAAFSPSGLSLNEPAKQYHQALLEELFQGRHERLGDALLAAQKTYTETGAMPELITIYHLLGDPALTLEQ